MILTNTYHLPEAIVKAVNAHKHKQGTYSVTEILNSPRIVHLSRRHFDEMEEDVSDRIWALLGSSVHFILEKGEGKNQFSEQYLTKTFDSGVTLSGTADLFDGETGVLTDYKITSVWSVIYADRSSSWEKQLNIYAWLYRQYSFDVKKLQIVAILRDWQKSKAYDEGYPPINVVTVPITLWTPKVQEEFITGRIEMMERSKEFADDELPACTAEDKWSKPDTWAVIKKDRKRADRVLASEVYAICYAKDHYGDDYQRGCTIEFRPGKNVRCEDYCPVRRWCNQYELEK